MDWLAVFKNVWVHPRETVQNLKQNPPSRLATFVIVSLAGMEASIHDSKGTILGILLMSITLGPITGFLFLYLIPSYITKWAGVLLGGKATVQEVRLVTLMAMIPMTISLFLWLPQVFVLGQEFKAPSISGNYTILNIFQSVFYIWSLVIFIRSLSEVQGFSIKRAILNTFLPLIIILVLLILISIPLFL